MSVIGAVVSRNSQKDPFQEYIHNDDRYADFGRVLEKLLVMRRIICCAARRVELAGAEGRSDGHNRDNRIMDGLWSIFR